MKNFWRNLALISLLVLVVAFVVSNPDAERHEYALIQADPARMAALELSKSIFESEGLAYHDVLVGSYTTFDDETWSVGLLGRIWIKIEPGDP